MKCSSLLCSAIQRYICEGVGGGKKVEITSTEASDENFFLIVVLK